MNTPTTLGVFAAGLAIVFGGAMGIGHAVGPVGTAAPTHGMHGMGSAAGEPAALPEGLSVSSQGYTLDLETTSLPQGRAAELSFRLLGPDGLAVTRYTPTQDKDLHLIVVRRDGSGFQHVHPVRDPQGRWTTQITLPLAGSYKVFADAAPDTRSEALVLSADLSVAGDYQPAPVPPVSRTVQVDGYTVTLTGDLVAGTEARLVLSISRDGRRVTDLQPYLAAYGHLVSLRSGDLAYLHTHPDGVPGDGHTAAGPAITFGVEVPTAGSYRLYLDFQHHDAVHTAEFTATATEAA